jgi:putative chitinase
MSIKELQKKIGVNPDGAFGPNTLKAAMRYYKLTPERAAHFFAQTSHETGEFRTFVENLNYGATSLNTMWKKYFPTQVLVEQYARKPEQIANRIYGNRMGNGPEPSGDGWRYRGRGALQLTGKDNYTLFAKHLNRPDILTNPDIVANELAFESAFFFFERNRLWTICDRGTGDNVITEVTKRINGGTNGLRDRIEKTKKYYKWLTA